jgi:hypothetical protein
LTTVHLELAVPELGAGVALVPALVAHGIQAQRPAAVGHPQVCDRIDPGSSARTTYRSPAGATSGRSKRASGRCLVDQQQSPRRDANAVRRKEGAIDMAKQTWRDMSPRRRAGIVALGAVELALTATAARDLARRPGYLVHGPKALWWPAIFVQPVGPVAYLVWGRGPRASGRPSG